MLGEEPVFMLIEGRDTIRLPLPKNDAYVASLQKNAAVLADEAKSIPLNRLDEAQRNRLAQLLPVLDSLAQTDPVLGVAADAFSVNELLRHFSGSDKGVRHPALLTRLVEQLPAYYTQVQNDWPHQPILKGAVQKLLYAGTDALDQLDAIEMQLPNMSVGYQERLRKAIPDARRAIKDHLGWCLCLQF
ncbi:MAG: hypothetical protein ACOYNO_10640 [Saprospiraceae bacterium]